MDERLAMMITAAGGDGPWSPAAVTQLSNLEVPEPVYGRLRDLLLADSRLLWARWYVASLVDAERILAKPDADYGDLYRAVVEGLEVTTVLPAAEVRQLAKVLAEQAGDAVAAGRSHRTRLANTEHRDRLLAAAGAKPRCWICGYAFDEDSIDRLSGSSSHRPDRRLPTHVDRFKPMGVAASNFAVRIDHVRPHSRGGVTEIQNLRLCCGWCNGAKGGMLGLYDGSLRPRTVAGEGRVPLSCPRPFWIARLLAVRGRCEHPEGCTKTTSQHELSVVLRHEAGAAVPQNLTIRCEEHNKQPSRFVRREAMRDIRDAEYI